MHLSGVPGPAAGTGCSSAVDWIASEEIRDTGPDYHRREMINSAGDVTDSDGDNVASIIIISDHLSSAGALFDREMIPQAASRADRHTHGHRMDGCVARSTGV